jgi:hypothetical protein
MVNNGSPAEARANLQPCIKDKGYKTEHKGKKDKKSFRDFVL